MASIYKRRSKDEKSFSWRAVIRMKGYPIVCNCFDRKQEAEDWAKDTERRIKQGQYNFETKSRQFTYSDLMKRVQLDGILDHHRSRKNVHSQFEYWEKRFGAYALAHITPELISEERQLLIETIARRGKPAANSTINRYMATLSTILSHGVKRLRWIQENPCSRISKLKENGRRDRLLNDEEMQGLLKACKDSKSPYLYCIVLIALTTGARKSEILSIEKRDLSLENKLAYLRNTKNGKPRSIALSDLVITELKKILDMTQPNKPLVFASRTAFGKVDIKKAWAEALRKSDIRGYVFHSMRHQFATSASGLGASNLEMACCMGHSTLQMLQHYTHLDVAQTKKYSEQISERLTEIGVKNDNWLKTQ